MAWADHNHRPQLHSSCPPGFEGSKRYISRGEAASAVKRQAAQQASERRAAKRQNNQPPQPQQPDPPPIVRCPHCDQYNQLHVHQSTSSAGKPLFLLGCNRRNEPIRYVPAETAAGIKRLAEAHV